MLLVAYSRKTKLEGNEVRQGGELPKGKEEQSMCQKRTYSGAFA
jgi:hypothetical protein